MDLRSSNAIMSTSSNGNGPPQAQVLSGGPTVVVNFSSAGHSATADAIRRDPGVTEVAQSVTDNTLPRSAEAERTDANESRGEVEVAVEEETGGGGGDGGGAWDRDRQGVSQYGFQGNQSQASSGGGGGGGTGRSYKEMIEAIKSLHSHADKLQERMCKIQGDFAELLIKSVTVFDPATVQILTHDCGIDMTHPDAHYTRQEVDEYYGHLSEKLDQGQNGFQP